MKTKIDQRPAPKPRKLAALWQMYLFWHELVILRIRHSNRISSVEAGKSNYDAELEKAYVSLVGIDEHEEFYRKQMIEAGKTAGDIWAWVTSIRGLKEGGLAAQLIAQIDDISTFTNISKLWRFAGYAVIDGKAEHNKQGEKAHKNNLLQAVVWNIGDQFIKQQTPLYVDIYYQEKARLRELYPMPIDVNSGSLWPQKFTDMHVHRMAKRKMEKVFLSHLWLKWREAEGLPVTMPYAIAILNHADYIPA